MSENLSEVGHRTWSGNDIDRRLAETREWMDAQHALACRTQERQQRQDRRVLGFIPGALWELWPTLLVAILLGSLTEFGVSELLVHHLSLAAACR